MATSRYVQITDWALLEYEYGSAPDQEIAVNLSKVFKLENGYNNTYQFLNGDISLNLTGNVQDRSSASQSTVGNKWAYLDIDTIIPVINQDANLNLVEETNNLTSPNIIYDTVKIHIVSGFNLDGLEGIISQLSITDNSGSKLDLANHTFLSSQNDYKFNTNPLFLGDRLYDKYIEFKIPSFSSIQSEFYANPSNSGSFGYIFSKDNTGFVKDSLIDFTLHEITNVDTLNGNQYFITGEKYELSFLPADQFGLLGATIRESDEGDYFEYYATWDNGFPEDYIARLNGGGADWAIIHQVEVREQIGTSNVKTYNMTSLQDNEYDKPNIFRPVILNSDIAFSFSIDYTMRFLNRTDGQQIIRTSTFSSYEPKKYGKDIEKITVSEGYRPMKVYNKIVRGDEQSNSVSYKQSSPGTFKTITETKYVPNFFNNTNVALSTYGKDSQELDDNIWGQGKAIILLNEFDNRIRFKLFDKNKGDREFEQLDLTTEPSLLLSFVYDDGTKKYITQSVDANTDPTAGEVEFFIKGDDSVRILEQQTKRFYIISRGGDGDSETVIYQGEYDNFANRDNVVSKLTSDQRTNIKKEIARLQKEQIKFAEAEDDLDEKIAQQKAIRNNIASQRLRLQNQKQDLSNAVKILRSEQEKLRKKLAKDNQSISKQRANLIEAIKKNRNKKIKKNSKFRLREVPGKKVQLGKGFKSIKPKVLKPAKPSTNVQKLRNNPTKK